MPAGGWGFRWVGDPDHGFGIDQPGGWIYNILPYIEQEALHQLGAGNSAEQKKAAAHQLSETPLSFMCCPTRRPSVLYPHREDTASVNRPHNPGFDGVRCNDLNLVARGDYAANSGDTWNVSAYGPETLAEADTYAWTAPSYCNGINFIHAVFKMIDITDGTSQTYLVGEKYMNPDNYYTWDGVGDCQPMYIGYDPDINRTTYTSPLQDTPGTTACYSFGSAHSNGFHMSFCDGSVRIINYSIDKTVHAYLGNRMDGMVLDAKSY